MMVPQSSDIFPNFISKEKNLDITGNLHHGPRKQVTRYFPNQRATELDIEGKELRYYRKVTLGPTKASHSKIFPFQETLNFILKETNLDITEKLHWVPQKQGIKYFHSHPANPPESWPCPSGRTGRSCSRLRDTLSSRSLGAVHIL